MPMYNSFDSIRWLKTAQLRAQHGTLIINILWVRKSLHQFIICLKWMKKEELFYEKDEIFVFIFQRLLNLQRIPSNESCMWGFRFSRVDDLNQYHILFKNANASRVVIRVHEAITNAISSEVELNSRDHWNRLSWSSSN